MVSTFLVMGIVCSRSPAHAKESKDSKITIIAATLPVIKIQFRPNGTFLEPAFVPGAGLGYIWGGGRFGVVGFPLLGMLDRDTMMFAPHLSFHAYYLSIGAGYELRFSNRTNEGWKMNAAYPMLTFGVTLPVQQWLEQK
ncbi:MAG TPA: hypothetical protein PK156_34760 [Polyangium sp.]|nr:hypothetical protein [Polyangium sp.]